jgi:hypothetical protein
MWVSEKHHLLSWVLSLETARKHHPKTTLITDDEGFRLLVDDLGLQFDQVSLALNALENQDPAWWALGKLYTYRAQTDPFVHIDSDVFLWKALPDRMVTAPLLAQNPEYFLTDTLCYKPEAFENAIQKVNGWLPEQWVWYRTYGLLQKGYCCGLFGGVNMDFIHAYADLAIQLIEHPANQLAWELLDSGIERNILVEQYLLSACLEYSRYLSGSASGNLDMQCLFDSMNDSFIPAKTAQAGFTHLMSAKRNQAIADRLENRVRRDYPQHYERCIRYDLSEL